MFNYYTYQKKRNESLKEKKNKIKQIKMNKINKIKRDELIHNYEERVKKFIYKISDDPNFLSKNNSLSLSLNKEKNIQKELYNNLTYFNEKRFNFSNFETDRARAEKYDENKKKYEKLLNEKFPEKNIKNTNNKSFSPKIPYNKKLFNKFKEIKVDYENEKYKMRQPRLRFKPRNDIERLLDEIKDLRTFHGNKDYLNTLKKQILKMQKFEFDNEKKKGNELNKLFKFYKSFKMKEKENNNLFNVKQIEKYKNNKILDLSNYNIDDTLKNLNDTDDIEKLTQEELIEMKKREGKIKKENKEKLKNDSINFKFKDFLETKKNLHKGYDIKTYFNCMKNYSLWKGSCFSNNNIIKNKYKYKSIDDYKSKLNFSPSISPKKTLLYFPSFNKNEKNKNFSKTFYRPKKRNNNFEPEHLILLLNNYKNNYVFENENGKITIMEKYNINENNPGENVNENKNKLKIVKKIAFDEDFKGYNSISNKTAENFLKFKKRIIKIKDYDDEEDEKSKNKNLGEMCNNILKKYGIIKNIYRESDALYSKEGNGKLMFTNGLTVSQFSKLHNFNI